MITVGVFDSGVGGLSVLRALRAELPQVHFVYLADNAHAPYGERSPARVVEWSQHITERLRRSHGIQALVVACNTATALGIDALRHTHADLPIIGVEPALKPAAAMTRTGHIGVLATRRTLESPRFAVLRERVLSDAGRPLQISSQACDGLADAIERGDPADIAERVQHHMDLLRQRTGGRCSVDTLVLGCTHYPLISGILQAACGPQVQLVETGTAVARRARALLGLLPAHHDEATGQLTLISTGGTDPLIRAATRWLDGLALAPPSGV